VRKLLLIALIAALIWAGYGRNPAQRERHEAAEITQPVAEDLLPERPAPSDRTPPVEKAFSCDGRTRCPEMKSCDEALHFIAHCPGTQMDGDDDGVPCETQWCEHLR
jgi:hypothetical protein